MYAIVEIAGQQFKAEKGKKLFVHRLENKEGSKVDFDKVLLIDNDKKVTVGAPYIKDAKISAKVLTHLKGDKVKVFKKKRRKGYQKLNGHRQYLTEIEVSQISEKKTKATAEKTDTKKAASKPAAKTTAKAEDKKASAKKPTEKKTAAKPKAEKKEDK